MDAAKKIMFVCTKEALMTNALMNKIKLRGTEPFYVHDAGQLAEHSGEEVYAVVYYMNDDAGASAALHAALDADCARRGARVLCIGTKEQYDAFRKDFTHPAELFERPLDMERFLACAAGEADATARRKRVLVVDDDASYREFLRDWLRGTYEVVMANGGEQAMKVLAAQKCDLVLLDYEMPLVSGAETMERIRALPDAQRPPVIFLTGSEDEARIQHILSLHPAGYLLKNLKSEALLAKVGEVLA